MDATNTLSKPLLSKHSLTSQISPDKTTETADTGSTAKVSVMWSDEYDEVT